MTIQIAIRMQRTHTLNSLETTESTETQQPNKVKTLNKSIKIWESDVNQFFSKEETHMANKFMKMLIISYQGNVKQNNNKQISHPSQNDNYKQQF